MAECIVIPAYNAEKTIEAVAVEALATGLPLLVVDDGSKDRTAERVRGLPLSLVVLPQNRGKGGALKVGFAWALSRGYDGVITLDADGQHEVSAVGELAARARAQRFDILIASRCTQFRQMTGLRRSWNLFGAWCIKKRTGFDIDDSQSGFRFYSSRLLRQVRLQAEGYDLEMEILLKAWRAGCLVGTLPVAARVADGSSTSHYRAVIDTCRICLTFLRYM